MIRRILRTLIHWIFSAGQGDSPTHYQIGNVKYQNARIDSLMPQFVKIGDNFISAPGSVILAHDASVFVHTGAYRCQRTVIGDNVFLGANAVVLPGVHVGDGAIIGAGAVVTRDVEALTVVAGNPAKTICTVDQYIEKCRANGSLYLAPDSFKRIWKNERPSPEDIAEFQRLVLARASTEPI